MTTLKQEEKLIDQLKSLTELELQSLLEELREHIYMNSFQDMVHRALGTDDVLEANEELNEEIDRLNDKISIRMEPKISVDRKSVGW